MKENCGIEFRQGTLGELYLNPRTYRDLRGELSVLLSFPENSSLAQTFEIREFFYSKSKFGAVRGMHCPKAETFVDRVIGVISGKAHDILIDLRSGSNTNLQQVSNVLSKDSGLIYVPGGVAHGFQSLEDGTIIIYFFPTLYSLTVETGVSPISSAINWSAPISFVSDKDKLLPKFEER